MIPILSFESGKLHGRMGDSEVLGHLRGNLFGPVISDVRSVAMLEKPLGTVRILNPELGLAPHLFDGKDPPVADIDDSIRRSGH